jgi:hypothetical protein
LTHFERVLAPGSPFAAEANFKIGRTLTALGGTPDARAWSCLKLATALGSVDGAIELARQLLISITAGNEAENQKEVKRVLRRVDDPRARYILGLIHAKKDTDRSRKRAVALWADAPFDSAVDTGDFCKWGRVWFGLVRSRCATVDREAIEAMYSVAVAALEGRDVMEDRSLAGALFAQVFRSRAYTGREPPEFDEGKKMFLSMLARGDGVQKNRKLAYDILNPPRGR